MVNSNTIFSSNYQDFVKWATDQNWFFCGSRKGQTGNELSKNIIYIFVTPVGTVVMVETIPDRICNDPEKMKSISNCIDTDISGEVRVSGSLD
jgi:hypothetical protein